MPFPFFAGVLLYRIRLPPFIAHRLGAGLIVGLGAVLLAPVDAPGSLGLVYVLLVFPAVIATGAAVTVGPALSKACWLAGQLSYPIYILQGPILRVGEEVLKYRPFEGSDAWLFGAAEACLVVAVAWTALTLYDEPLQALFKRRVRRALAEPSAPLPSR